MTLYKDSLECQCDICHGKLKYDIPLSKATKQLGHPILTVCSKCFNTEEGELTFYKKIIRHKTDKSLALDLDKLDTCDLMLLMECTDITDALSVYVDYANFIEKHQQEVE